MVMATGTLSVLASRITPPDNPVAKVTVSPAAADEVRPIGSHPRIDRCRGFDTGAVKELVIGDAGRVVPYGSNSWNIEPPDISALAVAAKEILQNQPHFSQTARTHAESALGLDKMVDAYLKVLLTTKGHEGTQRF